MYNMSYMKILISYIMKTNISVIHENVFLIIQDDTKVTLKMDIYIYIYPSNIIYFILHIVNIQLHIHVC